MSEKRSQARKGANQNAIIDGTNADKRVTKSEQTPTSDNQISTTDGTNADTNTSTNTNTSTQINTPALPTIGGGATNTNAPNESDAAKKQTAVQRRFDEFWGLYPNKKAKQDAIKAWGKIKPDEALFTRIMDAIREQLQSEDWRKENGRFIPHPATWLNSGRWEDVVTSSGNAPPPPQSFKPSTGGRSLDEYRNGDETP